MHDRRGLNNMAPEIRLVHLQLDAWASWARDDVAMMGLPAETYLSRWAEYGIQGAQQRGKPPMMPDAVAVVDSAIAKLPQELAHVVRTFYLRWEPINVMASRCRMTRSRFEGHLSRARWYIAGALAK